MENPAQNPDFLVAEVFVTHPVTVPLIMTLMSIKDITQLFVLFVFVTFTLFAGTLLAKIELRHPPGEYLPNDCRSSFEK